MTQATIPAAEAKQPTEAHTLAVLSELIGKALAKELWALTVDELNLTRPVTDPHQLRAVAERLMTIADASRVAGRALRAQVITYQALG